MKISAQAAASAFWLAASLCWGQTSQTMVGAPAVPPRGALRSVSFSVPTALLARGGVVTGAPYCANEISESTRLLADGNRIANPAMTRRVCRDSQGRTRTERAVFPSIENSPVNVEIRDPVSGFAYVLDSQSKTAYRVAMQSTNPVNLPSSVGARDEIVRSSSLSSSGVENKMESLGEQMIEGIPAKGRRTTITYPPGAQNNDQTMVVVTESWTAPELNVLVLSSNTGRGVENKTRLTHIVRAEPDLILFQSPSDYRIVDETQPSIRIQNTLP